MQAKELCVKAKFGVLDFMYAIFRSIQNVDSPTILLSYLLLRNKFEILSAEIIYSRAVPTESY